MSSAVLASRLSPEDLARRRAGARRLAWALGAAVLALYVAAFFLQR